MKKALVIFLLMMSVSMTFAQLGVPVLSTPTDGSSVNSLSTTLYWNSVSNITYYDYQYDTTANFDSPVLVSGTRSRSYRNISISGLRMNTTYYWRVRTRTASDTSAWSQAFSFNIPGLTVTAPEDGTTATTPYVYISYSLPSGASIYTAFDTVPTFDSPAYTYSQSSSFSLPYFGKTYYWRARAYANSEYTPWSETRTLFLPSTGPQLYSPANNSTVTSESTELYWQNDNSYSMQVQYDTVPTFNSPMLYQTTTTSSYLYTESIPSGARVYWRVRYYNGTTGSDWSETRVFTRLGGVQPVNPINGALVSSLSPSLTFSGMYGYYINYQVRCDTVPTFQSGALVTNSYSQYYTYSDNTYSCSVSGLHFDKEYYWQVRTIYDGDTSAWSNTATFRTPGTLTLSSPQNGSVQSNTYCELSWNSISGVNNYVYLIDTVPTFGSSALMRGTVYNTYADIELPYLGKTYYWKVGACTQNDTCWSEVWNFSVNGKVTLSYPSDGTTVSGLETELGWNSLGNSYLLNIDTTSTFGSPAAVTYTMTDTYRYISGLKFGQRYFWRVCAVSGSQQMEWSDTWSFTVQSSVNPYSPSNNSTLSSNSTYLYWDYFTGAEDYTVQMDTTATFDSPSIQSYTTTSTEYYVSSLAYAQNYYWRVKARNGSSESDWSNVMRFSTIGTVTLNSPSNGSIVSNYSSVYFYWNYNYNISYYHIQYDTVADFSSPLATQSLQEVYDYSTYLYDFEPNKIYYWHVRALSPYDYSPLTWSETWSFSTESSVEPYSPANGSTLNGFYTYLECNTRNVDGWIYQLDTTESFNSPELRTDNYYNNYVENLDFGTTYYWRVAGVNGTDTMAWGDVWSFTTVDGRVQLQSPVDGYATNAVTQYLTWTNISDCNGYQYQCDTVSTFDSPALISGIRNSGYNFITLNDLYYEKTHYWRVRCMISSDTSAWSETWTFRTIQHPTLVSPVSGTALEAPSATLTWNSIQGTRTYQYQYDTTANFASPALISYTTSSNSVSISPLYYGPEYSWRMRAINYRDTSAWSDIWTFTTPRTVVLSTPANGSELTGVSSYFYWNYLSSDYYLFQIDTVSTFNSQWLRNANVYDYGINQSNLPYGRTLYWRVAAVNNIDQSDWSDVWTVTTPASVTLVSPYQDATNISSTVSLSWQLISGSTSYQYQYDTVPTFDSPLAYTGTRGSSYNSVSISNLLYNTNYYWRVRAINYNLPDTSLWSETRHFTTSASVALSSPANGSVSNNIANTLYWNSVNGSNYIYNIDTVATFNSPALQSGSTSSTSAYFSNLYYGKTYYWRIAAYNSNDTTAWSEVWSFTTPSTILLNTPENELVINTLSQTLSWYSCDGTSYYEYQYDTLPTFDSPALYSSTSSYTSVTVSNLCYETRTYWRVRGWNNVDVSDWSEVRYFNTDNAMTLYVPANDSVLQVVNPQLRWNTYDGSSYYQYQYDTTATFDSPLYYTGTTSYLYRSLSYLQYGATYHWRVRAYHSRDTSAWSPVWSFTTPSTIALSTPEQNSIVNTLSPTLYWNSCSGTTTYEYQYDTVATFDSPAMVSGIRSSSYNYAYTSNLQYDTQYFWRVRGWHSSDTSDWSPAWSFRTAGSVTLLTPANGDTVTNISNTVYWQEVSGSNYILEMDTVPTFDSPVLQHNTTYYTYYSYSNLYYGKTYYWRVAAYANGDTTVWSDVWHFTTPDKIILSSPEIGSENTTLSQYFYWNTCSGTNYYQYQVDTLPTFDSPAVFAGTRSSSYNYVSLSNLFYENEIYWRVRGWNSVDTSDWSDTWYITTTGRMTLSAPVDGTILTTANQTLSWNSYSGTSYYQYEYDTTANFNSPSRVSSTTSSTSVSISNLIYDTRYHWHVRAINSRDTSAWSDVWTFTTPVEVTLLTPADGTISTTISNSISWQSISGSSYIYDLDTVATFDSPAHQTSYTSSTSRSFSNLYYGATYYWRVAAYNSNDTSRWSEVWTFVTPAKIELSSPAIGTVVSNSLSQYLYWNTCTGTNYYQYQVDTLPTFDSPAVFAGTRSSSYNYVSLSNLFYENEIYWRVRGWNSVDTSDWSDTWYFTTVGRMQLTSPADGTELSLVNQTLSWNSYPGSSSYQYQYDTTANFNSAAMVVGTTSSTSYSASNFYFGATYHWRVRAIDSRDTSAWSDVWTFTTPAVVTLVSPEDESVLATVSQQLRWNSIGNNITYQLQYDTAATFSSPILVTYNTTSTYYTASSLCYGAHYYWRVRATNSVETSSWSDVWEFNTQGSVTLISPDDSSAITDITTYITWSSFPGTSNYQYQYDTVPTFDSPLSSMISTTSTSAYLSNLQYGKTYYWHVRAINSANASAWSETWTFTTPGSVTLSSPENGYVSTTISNTLYWNSISGSSSYIYEIDTVSTFDSPVYGTNTTSGTSYSLYNLYFGKTYYWRVKAQNSYSTSDWSETWHFTTPSRTTLSSPADSTDITTLSQTIYWNTLSGTTTYQYQCDTTANFDSPALISGTRSSSYSYVSLSSLCFESTNYWRVRCINSVDTSDWSEVWTFNTVGRMTLSSPADLSTLSGVSQTLYWNSYSGATRYEYQYDTTATFNSPIAVSYTTTSTSASISNLAYAAHYYWRVRAINSRDTSAWSDVWNFFTPSAIQLVSPADGYASSSVSISLQWTGISGSSYIYELDTVPTFDSPLYYSSTTSYTSVSVSSLHYGKTYYWRVAAINSVDMSAWSSVWSFTTPARTTLSSPADGTVLTSLSQYFYWNTLSGTSMYEYQVDTLPDFTSPASFTGTRSSSYNYVSLSNLFFENTIYWRVRCINSVDTSDWSDTWSVMTTGQMTLQSPADGTNLTSTNTYLYWNSYNGASYYQYQYDTTATFDSPFVYSGITSSTSSYISGLSYGVTYYWHVRAVNSRDSSAWSETWTFMVSDSLTLISPADGTALSSVSSYFNWSGISGSSYLLQKDTVPTFNSPALTNNTTSSTSLSLSNLYYGRTHYWRVAAYNSTDTSAWSEVWRFTTPARTTLSSPADGTSITSLSQTIYWNTISGTNSYQYEYDTVPTFNSPAHRTGSAGTYYNYVTISNLYFESTIYWRVRCINSVDTSDWSATWHFNTTGGMTLLSPADNSTISTVDVSLSWNSYTGASGYVYEYDTAPTFNTPHHYSGYSYYTSVSVSGLQYGTTYYWRARAINSVDSSAWSATWQFTTPGTITLTSPSNQTLVSGTDVTLQWSGISGSDYIYEVDTVATFNSSYRMTGTTYSTSRSFYSLYYGTTYYWRVAATNGTDTSAWSSVWSFTTPAAVTLSSPANGSTTYSTSLYLYWNSINGSYYRYELDETPNFDSPSLQTGTTYSTSAYFSGLSYGVTYYWRIQAYNDNDVAEWSQTWNFTILSSLLPNAPILISPANGSVNVPTGGQPLTWNSLPNATDYEVQYTTDSTFSGAATFIASSSLFMLGGLSTNTTYYWRVRGRNYNEYSPWSDVWHFTTANCSVYAPTQIESACETFSWRGRTLTASGVYRDTIVHTDECDSIYILSLTIYHNVQNEITVSAQGSYTWNGTTYNTSGDYVQTFTSAGGCDSTVTLHLTITTGIADHAILSGLQIYPNPTTGEFTVHISDSQLISEIRVYDMVGHLVMMKKVEGEETKMDLSEANPGMYVLRFAQNGRIVGSSKVIVTR